MYPSPDPPPDSYERTPEVAIITAHNEQPFCCDQIYPIKTPRTEKELCVWFFVELIKVDPEFTKWVQKYPTSLLVDCWLYDTDIIIEYENYEGAERVETRYFFEKPGADGFQFVEMDPEMVNWNVWRQNWESVKFRCDEHVGDRHWWSVRLLERVDPDAENRVVLAVKRKRRSCISIIEEKRELISLEEQSGGESDTGE